MACRFQRGAGLPVSVIAGLLLFGVALALPVRGVIRVRRPVPEPARPASR